MPTHIRHAAVALANNRQFHSGEVLQIPWVQSRMLLWRRAGVGSVRVNDRDHQLREHEMLLLPWNHAIRYTASSHDPILLAGIHIIPWEDPDVPSPVGVAHSQTAELANSRHRADRDLPGLAGICRLPAAPRSALRLLAEGVVESWQDGPPPDWQRRLHGQVLLAAALVAIAQPDRSVDLPPDVVRLQRFAGDNLHQPIGLPEMADFLGCSPSTVGRLLRRQLDRSPTDWLRSLRIERARELLSSTSMSIPQVAATVGIPDIPYFSKVFKRYSGDTPAAYRRRSRVF